MSISQPCGQDLSAVFGAQSTHTSRWSAGARGGCGKEKVVGWGGETEGRMWERWGGELGEGWKGWLKTVGRKGRGCGGRIGRGLWEG